MANRLAKEKSPYLLQHAQNPVDWYPWSDEAFAKANRDNKPIFLSIGYSTCHWCHVMEHESFEDQEVAELLNEAFVCIKVDREERPDIDHLYMTVCSMMTGSGGWPLTIVMTPDQKPFFAGTYFPKHTQYGRLGMLELVPRLQDIWRTRQDEVVQSTDKILEALQHQYRSSPGGELDHQILHRGFRELADRFDSARGGFSRAPKFPTPHNLSFLMRYWRMTGEEQALAMVERTLTAMRLGGIFDQIGFGFHRYSTDEKWLLPHFEKMLYDQALVAVVYLEAFQITGSPLFKQTVEEIFSYVLRDMRAAGGGFYSAEDADSEGVEGKYYVWSFAELQEVLTPEEADLFCQLYHVRPDGNFLDEATKAKTGENIFYLDKPLPELAVGSNIDREDFLRQHEQIRRKLFSAREKRIHPYKDDKILTDWNGLMIGALAIGGRILANDSYVRAAEKGAEFIISTMLRDDRLRHRYRENEAAVEGMLCDYAFMVWGLLELYETTFRTDILKQAIYLNKRMLDLFWDDQNGGFFMTAEDGESLLVRPREVYDGALPSGNSIALHNLLRLDRITADSNFGAKAKLLIHAFSAALQDLPSGYTQFLSSMYYALESSTEVVIVGNPAALDTQEMLAVLHNRFLPETLVLLKNPDSDIDDLTSLAPFTADYVSAGNQATAYVCRDFSCKSPTTDPVQLDKYLRK